jgi:hypothetical protein
MNLILTLLPTSAPPKSLSIRTSFLTNTLGQVRILVGFSTSYIAVNIPAGPPLHYPVEDIYSEKNVSAITNEGEQIVIGVAFCSIWDYLTFDQACLPGELLGIGDPPILPGSMRAPLAYCIWQDSFVDGFMETLAWNLGWTSARVNCGCSRDTALSKM